MPKLNRYITEKAVKEIENLLNKQLNGIGKMQKYNPNGSSNPFWRDMNKRAYYMEHVHLQPEHLKYVLEEKKALVKWILENYPQYNVPYDPTKLIKRGGRINLDDRFYNAETREELEDLKGLFNNQAVAHAKNAQHGSQNPEVKIHQKAGMQYAYYVAYELMKKELDAVELAAYQTAKDFPEGD
ncbi:10797_t:CDS:2, partial [Funneliformis geosporum]